MEPKPKNISISVEGIVSARTEQPYVTLFHGDEQIAQLTVGQARNIAKDILNMCARTEADAMIFKFFKKHEFPTGAAVELLREFREFRLELDSEVVETSTEVPSTDQFDFTKKKPQ